MKISVAMCTYNGEKYIKKQIESILNQSLAIDEIVICDDGSNDKTIEIIEQFQLENPKIISLQKNQVNLGSNKNFEKAISICDGDYIFLSDQDDIWKKDKVKKIIQYFYENESLEAIFTNGELINDKNEKFTEISLWDSVSFMEDQLKNLNDLYLHLIFKSNMVTGATLCIKKEIKNLILPFPDIKNLHHDEWIAVIIASRKKIGYLKEELISYRLHSEQQIGTKLRIKKNRLKNNHLIIDQILGNSIPKSYTDHRRLAKVYYNNYLKFKKFSNNQKNDSHFIFKEISELNLEFFKKCDFSLKKANPVFYIFTNIIDKIRGKRQLNKQQTV